jgi:hypothetical protein
MTDTEAKSRNPNDQLAGAIAGWESEGGAAQAASRDTCVEQAPLTEDEGHVLQCLGAAVLVQWNDLPSRIQRQLFDHAASMGEPRYTTQLREQVARFLHKHKDDTQAPAF